MKNNPLFPKSDGRGLMGAYEYAALIDDDRATYSRVRQTGKKLPTCRTHRTVYVSGSLTDLLRTNRSLREGYKSQHKELRRLERGGEITRAEYRQSLKELKQNFENAVIREYVEFLPKPATVKKGN